MKFTGKYGLVIDDETMVTAVSVRGDVTLETAVDFEMPCGTRIGLPVGFTFGPQSIPCPCGNERHLLVRREG